MVQESTKYSIDKYEESARYFIDKYKLKEPTIIPWIHRTYCMYGLKKPSRIGEFHEFTDLVSSHWISMKSKKEILNSGYCFMHFMDIQMDIQKEYFGYPKRVMDIQKEWWISKKSDGYPFQVFGYPKWVMDIQMDIQKEWWMSVWLSFRIYGYPKFDWISNLAMESDLDIQKEKRISITVPPLPSFPPLPSIHGLPPRPPSLCSEGPPSKSSPRLTHSPSPRLTHSPPLASRASLASLTHRHWLRLPPTLTHSLTDTHSHSVTAWVSVRGVFWVVLRALSQCVRQDFVPEFVAGIFESRFRPGRITAAAPPRPVSTITVTRQLTVTNQLNALTVNVQLFVVSWPPPESAAIKIRHGSWSDSISVLSKSVYFHLSFQGSQISSIRFDAGHQENCQLFRGTFDVCLNPQQLVFVSFLFLPLKCSNLYTNFSGSRSFQYSVLGLGLTFRWGNCTNFQWESYVSPDQLFESTWYWRDSGSCGLP